MGVEPSSERLGGGTPQTPRQPQEAGCLLLQCFVWIQSLCCKADKSLPPNIFLSRTMCHASVLLLARTFSFFFSFPLMEPSLSAEELESGLRNRELPQICQG